MTLCGDIYVFVQWFKRRPICKCPRFGISERVHCLTINFFQEDEGEKEKPFSLFFSWDMIVFILSITYLISSFPPLFRFMWSDITLKVLKTPSIPRHGSRSFPLNTYEKYIFFLQTKENVALPILLSSLSHFRTAWQWTTQGRQVLQYSEQELKWQWMRGFQWEKKKTAIHCYRQEPSCSCLLFWATFVSTGCSGRRKQWSTLLRIWPTSNGWLSASTPLISKIKHDFCFRDNNNGCKQNIQTPDIIHTCYSTGASGSWEII